MPRSLAGQLALVVAVALLIAQSISFFLLWQAQERLRDARNDILITRFVAGLQQAEEGELPARWRDRRPPPPPQDDIDRERRRDWWRSRINIDTASLAATGEAQRSTTRRLLAALEEAGLSGREGQAAIVMRSSRRDEGELRRALALSATMEDGRWLNTTILLRDSDRLPWLPLIGQTVIIYVLLLGAVTIASRRLVRPLARLTEATRTMMTPQSPPPLKPEGPEDIRTLTEGFEDMRGRIRRMFAEKDVMLGAIGHDLRTPLTSLRIRVESVGDEKLRAAMIASVEELSALLDDILGLARNGHPDGDAELIDLNSLVADVVSGFPAADGRLSLEKAEGSVEISAYPALLRRALRNLIDNGLRYGENVTVRIRSDERAACISVGDDGPGIAEAELPRLRQAFERGEGSRNKATGGAGLGLALVDRIAATHGGELHLSNCREGGLKAELILPFKPDHSSS